MHNIGCTFCGVANSDRIIGENDLCLLMEDLYPVSPGHSLIIPRRCAPDYFALTEKEILAANDLMLQRREALLISDPTIDGFNVGLNCGESAGQTVGHCHFHLIPRRSGDVADPTGGVRAVIPGKANYTKFGDKEIG